MKLSLKLLLQMMVVDLFLKGFFFHEIDFKIMFVLRGRYELTKGTLTEFCNNHFSSNTKKTDGSLLCVAQEFGTESKVSVIKALIEVFIHLFLMLVVKFENTSLVLPFLQFNHDFLTLPSSSPPIIIL